MGVEHKTLAGALAHCESKGLGPECIREVTGGYDVVEKKAPKKKAPKKKAPDFTTAQKKAVAHYLKTVVREAYLMLAQNVIRPISDDAIEEAHTKSQQAWDKAKALGVPILTRLSLSVPASEKAQKLFAAQAKKKVKLALERYRKKLEQFHYYQQVGEPTRAAARFRRRELCEAKDRAFHLGASVAQIQQAQTAGQAFGVKRAGQKLNGSN